jgi:gamma-glutamyltranspeptidase/glutathione hydrolase
VLPALELAGNGFPIPESLHNALVKEGDKLIHDEGEGVNWPSTMEVFFKDGRALQTGEILVQHDLTRTFRRLIEVERSFSNTSRESALQATRDYFYTGDIAEEMVAFNQQHGGLLTLDDLREFSVGIETPQSVNYKGVEVYSCGPWCQGPVTLQTLSILETCDVAAMGHNSPAYLHTVIEALKLAFSDRHAFYGDPDFVEVPMQGLLDPRYGAERLSMIDFNKASVEMPDSGDPWKYQSGERVKSKLKSPQVMAGRLEADTSYISIIDKWGNAFSGTPSDGIGGGPTVPGLGFVMSPRGSQSWLDEDHPSCLQPGKRPRLTPTPSMAFKDDNLWMPFGTPGGDVQCQSMVQLFLNVVEFGMNVQEAIEAPRISTWSFPNSFWPHAYYPNLIGVEGRVDSDTISTLSKLGHQIDVWDDWTPRMGGLCAIEVDQDTGALFGGADLRRDGYAMGR